MISAEEFNALVEAMGDQAEDDIAWAQRIEPPPDAEEFAREAIYVICNSGMRFTVARQIFERVMSTLESGVSAHAAFGHVGKAGAIDAIWRDRVALYARFIAATDRLEFCGSLPWIGEVTKYHLAKNFGVPCVKPDVHLVRLATVHRTTPDALCADLARRTGLRLATIDTVLWRACATGFLDSRTGLRRC